MGIIIIGIDPAKNLLQPNEPAKAARPELAKRKTARAALLLSDFHGLAEWPGCFSSKPPQRIGPSPSFATRLGKHLCSEKKEPIAANGETSNPV
jgi:hypothetical protein